MDKKQKVWIRGCESKGAEVIQKLVALGGKEPDEVIKALAFDPGLIFFIGHDGVISHEVYILESAKIIMEEYTEIKIDEKAEDKPDNKANEQPEFNKISKKSHKSLACVDELRIF